MPQIEQAYRDVPQSSEGRLTAHYSELRDILSAAREATARVDQLNSRLFGPDPVDPESPLGASRLCHGLLDEQSDVARSIHSELNSLHTALTRLEAI